MNILFVLFFLIFVLAIIYVIKGVFVNKRDEVIQTINRLDDSNVSKLSDYADELESNQDNRTFLDVNSVKEYIYNFNEIYFSNKSNGLYWRKDTDENMSFRMKDRHAQKGEVGLNIDFNLIKKAKNISSENLEINVLVRNENLSKVMKNNGINVETPYTIRNRYTKTSMPGTYCGDILVTNIKDFRKIMKICLDSV